MTLAVTFYFQCLIMMMRFFQPQPIIQDKHVFTHMIVFIIFFTNITFLINVV